MKSMWQIGIACVLATLGSVACGAADETTTSDELGSASSAVQPAVEEFDVALLPENSDANCKKAQPKDLFIAELVEHSWLVSYPLTRLYVSATGDIAGSGSVPDLVAGDLEAINGFAAARDSVAQAIRKITGLPDYGMAGLGVDSAACAQVPVWTDGSVTAYTSTLAFAVNPTDVNRTSWKTTHKEFGKQCPLVKTVGNRDIVDPPGDGSTNDPVSATVSATGVRADVFGRCSSPWSYCKLSYATGINYRGRLCLPYNSQYRCLPF